MTRKQGRSAPRSGETDRPVPSRSGADGFSNVFTQMGDVPGNLQAADTYVADKLTLDWSRLEAMYETNWIAKQVVDVVADDVTAAGVQFTDLDSTDSDAMQNALVNLGVWDRLCDGIAWGRLYGGAIAVILIEGQDLATPFNSNTVGKGSFQGLHIIDRWCLQTSPGLIFGGAHSGEPQFYTVTSPDAGLPVGTQIDASRVIRFIGQKAPRRRARLLDYWGLTALAALSQIVDNYNGASQGASQLIQKAYLRVWKVDGLEQKLMSCDTEQALVRNMQHINTGQRIMGLTVIDAKDDFATYTYSFSGIADVMTKLENQISGATGIPMVRLLGQSPGGLNATGESDLTNYYDMIRREQEKIRTGLDTILRVVWRSEVRQDNTVLNWLFVPLWQMPDSVKITLAKEAGETIGVAFDRGLISQRVAMQELAALSERTGMFGSLSQADIDAAPGDVEPPDSEFVEFVDGTS